MSAHSISNDNHFDIQRHLRRHDDRVGQRQQRHDQNRVRPQRQDTDRDVAFSRSRESLKFEGDFELKSKDVTIDLEIDARFDSIQKQGVRDRDDALKQVNRLRESIEIRVDIESKDLDFEFEFSASLNQVTKLFGNNVDAAAQDFESANTEPQDLLTRISEAFTALTEQLRDIFAQLSDGGATESKLEVDVEAEFRNKTVLADGSLQRTRIDVDFELELRQRTSGAEIPATTTPEVPDPSSPADPGTADTSTTPPATETPQTPEAGFQTLRRDLQTRFSFELTALIDQLTRLRENTESEDSSELRLINTIA